MIYNSIDEEALPLASTPIRGGAMCYAEPLADSSSFATYLPRLHVLINDTPALNETKPINAPSKLLGTSL